MVPGFLPADALELYYAMLCDGAQCTRISKALSQHCSVIQAGLGSNEKHLRALAELASSFFELGEPDDSAA